MFKSEGLKFKNGKSYLRDKTYLLSEVMLHFLSIIFTIMHGQLRLDTLRSHHQENADNVLVSSFF